MPVTDRSPGERCMGRYTNNPGARDCGLMLCEYLHFLPFPGGGKVEYSSRNFWAFLSYFLSNFYLFDETVTAIVVNVELRVHRGDLDSVTLELKAALGIGAAFLEQFVEADGCKL